MKSIGWIYFIISCGAIAAPFPSAMREDMMTYCVKNAKEVDEICVCVINRLEQSISVREAQTAIDALKANQKANADTEKKFHEAVDDCKKIN